MLLQEIENLKAQLNMMIASEDSNYDEILNISQKLDVLIVKYLRETYIALV